MKRKLIVTLLVTLLFLAVCSSAYAMPIFVQIPDKEVSVWLEVEPGDSINNVKAKVEDNEKGIPAWRQRLFFCGRLLMDGHTLADYGIQKNAALYLVIRTLGHNHDESWRAWTATNTLPCESGRYYLTNDVELESDWELPSRADVSLSLDGYRIELQEEAVIRIGGTLNLYEDGINPGMSGLYQLSDSLPGIIIGQDGLFNMYGGQISYNQESVRVEGGGRFNMYAGMIEECATGVRTYGEFNLYGGTVADNTTDVVISAEDNRFGSFLQAGGTVGGVDCDPTSFAVVTLDFNDGSDRKELLYVQKNSAILPAARFSFDDLSYEGYILTGCNTRADGLGEAWRSDDSITVSADMTLYAQWKEPSSVTLLLPCAAVEANAFENDTTFIVVDASRCASIGQEAFKGCTGLAQIHLPKDCSIDSSAFDGCGPIRVFAPPGGTTQTDCADIANCVFVAE